MPPPTRPSEPSSNGGSAATASHRANDLGKGASYGRQGPRFRVIALTDNVPWITALANDVGYEVIFAEQLRNLGQPGDVLLAISGSGNSPNILAAVGVAKEIGMEVIGWTGFGGGELAEAADRVTKRDLSRPVPPLGPRELETVRASLNTMMAELDVFHKLQVDRMLEEKARITRSMAADAVNALDEGQGEFEL